MAEKIYSEEILKEIISWIRKGANNKEIAALIGVSQETFYNWQRPTMSNGQPNPQYHPELSDAIKRAENKRKVAMVNRILITAKSHWQAAAWYLERKFPEEFAEYKKTENVDPAKELEEFKRLAFSKDKEEKPADENANTTTNASGTEALLPTGEGSVQESGDESL